MPGWDQADLAKLEAACASTEVEAFGQEKYSDLPSKAAKLFYSVTKAHGLPNGNKRLGVVATITYLVVNGAHLTAPVGSIAAQAKRVSESKPHTPEGRPDLIIASLIPYFEDGIEPIDWGED